MCTQNQQSSTSTITRRPDSRSRAPKLYRSRLLLPAQIRRIRPRQRDSPTPVRPTRETRLHTRAPLGAATSEMPGCRRGLKSHRDGKYTTQGCYLWLYPSCFELLPRTTDLISAAQSITLTENNEGLSAYQAWPSQSLSYTGSISRNQPHARASFYCVKLASSQYREYSAHQRIRASPYQSALMPLK